MPMGLSGCDQMLPQKDTVRKPPYLCAIFTSLANKAILDACVLAVLEQGESYGYQMVKDINEFIEISESTLYPILKRLENAQMLTVFKQEHNGRLRKYYRITDAGRDHITELMNEWEEVVRVFQYISREREQSHEKGSVS